MKTGKFLKPGNTKRVLTLALLIQLALTTASIPSVKPTYGQNGIYVDQINRGFIFNSDIDSPSTYGPYYDWCQTWFTEITPSGVQTLHSYGTKVMLYRNLRAVYRNFEDYQIFAENSWLLRDKSGQIVYNSFYGTDYQIADFGNPAVQDHIASWIATKISTYDFDGVMLDNSFGTDKWTIFNGVNQQPINPRTGEEWTSSEIQTALTQCHSKIKSTIGNKTLVTNGLYTGTRYFNNPEEYEYLYQNSKADGIVSEGAFYFDDGNWLSEYGWKQSVDAISIQTGQYDRFAVIYTYNDVLPAGCTNEQMFLFGLCSMLLGVQDNGSYYGFGNLNADNVQFMESFGQACFDTANALGSPISEYYKDLTRGLYVRYFQNGIVCVNPTDTTKYFEANEVNEHSGKIILTVVPEFPMAVVVPFLIIATLPIVIIFGKRTATQRKKGNSRKY